MSREEIEYIISYSGSMTPFEHEVFRSNRYMVKSSGSKSVRHAAIERGWISMDPKVQDAIANGMDLFAAKTAKRVVTENPDMKFVNRCPKCGGLARTIRARQCRQCSHSWFDQEAASGLVSWTEYSSGI